MSDVVAGLQASLGKSVLSVSCPSANRWFMELGDSSAVQTAVGHLARLPAARLITISCSDYPAYSELLYHVDIGNGILTLRAKIWKPENVMNSIAAAMPAAELIEHEITELFGLEFEGNPRPNNMILSESQSQLLPLRNRVSTLEARMNGNVANIVEHGSTTAPSKRVMKSRCAIGMPESPPLCSVTCPGKDIVFRIAESSGTVARHPNIRKKEGGQ